MYRGPRNGPRTPRPSADAGEPGARLYTRFGPCGWYARPVRRVVIIAAVATWLTGCAPAIEQRLMQGPTAEEVFRARTVTRTGKPPSFEERGPWQIEIDGRISRYLAQHPEFANSPEMQNFRFGKQVRVGMPKEQVVVLLGEPEATVTDAVEMEKLARVYWPEIKGKATEVLVYPGGWRIFVKDGSVVDVVRWVPPRYGI